MPVKRPRLVINEIYHVLLRGVGDSLIFKNDDDRYRTMFSLYEFNTAEPVVIRERRRRRRRKTSKEQFSEDLGEVNMRKKKLVEVLAFYLMPNHIHLLLRQVVNNGITQFMRKFGAGYATYFNRKYSRRGHLFEGRFKAVHIKDNDQLQIVFAYIHTNGVALIEPQWKEKGVRDFKRVIKFLENYKWSSYQDYLGKKNFPSVTKRDFLSEVMGGEKGCRKFVNDWIKYKESIADDTAEVGLE